MKYNKFCWSSAFFFTTCANTTVNSLLRRCLEDVNTGANSISSSESELGCGPQGIRRDLAYIYHFMRIVGDKREKVKKIKRAFGILIGRDVFVALAVVVARHPIFMKVTVLFWFYCKRQSIRISWTHFLYYKTLRIYEASVSKSIETWPNRHLFNSDSRATST